MRFKEMIPVIMIVLIIVCIASCIRAVSIFNDGSFQNYRDEARKYQISYNETIHTASEISSNIHKQINEDIADQYLEMCSEAYRYVNSIYVELAVMAVIAVASLLLCCLCFRRLKPLLSNDAHYNYD